jgi:hypothetical protein
MIDKAQITRAIDAERNYSWDIPPCYAETRDYLVVTSPPWINNGVYTDEAKKLMAPLEQALMRFFATQN